jgi:HEAT repeat protein
MVDRIATRRVTRWVLLASAVAATLLAGVPLYRAWIRPRSNDAPADAALARRVNPAVLASVEVILAPPESGPEPEFEQLVARIVELGPSSIVPLLALSCGDARAPEFVPGTADKRVHPRAIEMRARVLEASLARFKDDQLVPVALDYAGGDAALDVKLVIVRLFGTRSASSALPAVFATLDGVDAIHFQRAFVQQSIESALGALLERDPLRIEGLEQKCRPELLPSLARAAGSVRSTATIDWLGRQLGRDDELDLTLLRQLGHAGGGGRLAIPDEALRRLRDSLTQASDERRRVAAAMLGELHDESVYDELVGLLDDQDVLLVGAARGALTKLVGRDLGPEADAWYDWRVAQDEWYDADAPAVYDQLFDDHPALASNAIAQLLSHPFFRHEAAAALSERLSAADGTLFATACTALTLLGSSRGTAGLVDALDRDDESQRETACAALHALTGLDLPPERMAWVRALDR